MRLRKSWKTNELKLQDSSDSNDVLENLSGSKTAMVYQLAQLLPEI
jgi:hypothetical protein